MNMSERVVFYEQIIDIVRNLHEVIKNNDDLGPKTKAINEAWCLLTLGSMQLHCKRDLKSSEKSFEDGLNMLNWTMNDSHKYWYTEPYVLVWQTCTGIKPLIKNLKISIERLP